MIWGVPHINAILIWGTCAILFLIGTYVLSRKSRGWRLVRRAVLLMLGLVGIGAIWTRPQMTSEGDVTTAHIVTDQGEAPDEILENEDHHQFNSVHQFLNSEIASATHEVHIHGLGLPRQDLELIKKHQLIFHPTEPIGGITHMRIPKITERNIWKLEGTYQGDDIQQIILTGPDSIKTTAILSDSTFAISSKAPPAGRYLYNITIYTKTDTIQELLPIDIGHEPFWSMLMLASYPSFESNYLKNYWTSLGNQFALRTKISQDKYSTSFVNMSNQNLTSITYRIATDFDFILTDISSWNSLTDKERSNISSAVRNEGTALIIKATEDQPKATNLSLPSITDIQEISWTTPDDPVDLVLYTTQSNWRSARQQGHTLLKYRSSGLGFFGMITLDNTYKLILADQPTAYQQLWSALFSALFRDFSTSSKLLHNPWIWAGEQNTISTLTDSPITSPPILNDTTALTYITAPFIIGLYDFDAYPRPSENTINISDTEQLPFYAHPQNTWLAVRQSQLRKINTLAAQKTQNKSEASLTTTEEIRWIWWLLLSVIGLGGLWLDERLW